MVQDYCINWINELLYPINYYFISYSKEYRIFYLNFKVEQAIKMKKLTIFCGFLLCGILSMQTAQAQDSLQSDARVKQRMLLNQFESDYVLTASERVALRQSRIAYQLRMKEILDTINISDSRRKRLIQELKKNPFSERVQTVIANHTVSEDTIKQ